MRFPHRVGSIRPRDREMSTGFSRDTPITAGVAFNRVNQRFDQRHSSDSRRISDRRAIRSLRVGPVDRPIVADHAANAIAREHRKRGRSPAAGNLYSEHRFRLCARRERRNGQRGSDTPPIVADGR